MKYAVWVMRVQIFAWLTLLLATAARGEPNLIGKTDRPLRYRPEGTDFVITNGAEKFNRPLYIRNSAMRVDAGDKPEFSLFLPARGGDSRLGDWAGGEGKRVVGGGESVRPLRPWGV